MVATAEVMTVKSAQANFEKMFRCVTDYNEPVTVVSDDDKAAVFVNMDEWSSLQETLYLYSIPGLVDSIKAAAAEPLEDGIPITEADFDV